MFRIAAIAIAMLLTDCAPTPYKPLGTDGNGGYSTKPLSPGKYEIRFAMNLYTDNGRGRDLALLRAAETAQENNFPFKDDFDKPLDWSALEPSSTKPNWVQDNALYVRGNHSKQSSIASFPTYSPPIKMPEIVLDMFGLKSREQETFPDYAVPVVTASYTTQWDFK